MSDSESLRQVADEVSGCTLCRLHAGRTKAVPGAGSTDSGILLIGEAPGAEEDRTGEPFVGMAGRRLDRALQSARLDRSVVYITNILKCRPPMNRSPRADEVRTCRPYLLRQIEAAGPSVIVALGGTSLRSLTGLRGPLKEYLGERITLEGIPVIATYHPAARRQAVLERLVEDLRRAKAIATGS